MKEKKPGRARMIVGVILVALQVVAVAGTLNTTGFKAGNGFFDTFAYYTGYFLVGIIGVVLIIIGYKAGKK